MVENLAARTLELIDIPSVSRDEQALLEHVRDRVPLPLVHGSEDALLYAVPRTGKPLVVLAGHLDTVPPQDNLPGRIEDGGVVGLGGSDMRGGLAVMVGLARWVADAPAAAVDLAFLFFAREELQAAESALPGVFAASSLVDEAGLVIMLEPTDDT